MKIALDAGHGYNTSGKRIPDGSMREWEFNNAVLYFIKSALEGYEEVSILVTSDPSGKTDVPLKVRTDKANQFGADLTLSIHANAFGAGGFNDVSGIETFIHPEGSNKSLEVAAAIQSELLRETSGKNRGVKRANFHMVRAPKGAAVLVECGFMTNKEEAEKLKTDAYRKKCAEAITKALVSVYKLKAKPKPKPKPAQAKPVQSKPAAPKKEESVQILTGGLTPEMVEEVSVFFKSKGWWAQVQFKAGGKNPRALSGGLKPEARAEFEAWLKERKWFYEIV